MNIIRQSTSFILVLALSLLISGCGGPSTGLSLVGDDNNPGDNPPPPITDLLSNPKPPAPVITTAEATTGSVFLKWTDTSSREYGFIIVRDGIKIGETDKNISEYTDSSVLPATTYTYLIVAWNKEGDGVSPERLVTTPALPIILPQEAQVRSIATDQLTGELYAAGMTTVALTDTPIAGQTDAFLAKFNPDGSLAFLNQWGTAECDNIANVIIFNNEVFLAWSGDDQYCIGDGIAKISRFDAVGNEIYTFQSPNSTINAVDGTTIYFKNSSKTDYQGTVVSWGPLFPWVNYSIGDATMRDGTAYYVGQSLALTDIGGAEGYTAAVDTVNNALIWTSRWGKQTTTTGHRVVANSSGIYTFGENLLVLRHDFSGNLLWTYQDTIRSGSFSHIVADDTAVYAMGDTFNGCGLTKITNDGAVAWQTSITGRSLAIFNNTLFVADDSNIIRRYDALTGESL